MILLITRRVHELADMRHRLLQEGMLVVVASASSALDATMRDRFDLALIDLASYEKQASALAFLIRHEVGVPFVGALQPLEWADHGFADFSVGENVHVCDLVDYLQAMGGYADMPYRPTDRIAGPVRVKAEENRAYCAMMPIDLSVAARAMLSLLVHRHPTPVSLEDLMEICFRPLGLYHLSVVSRTAKRINDLFEERFLPIPISCERGKGYFLSQS